MESAAGNIPQSVNQVQQTAWLVLTIAIFFAWWIYFHARFRQTLNLPERILAAFTLTVTQIVLTTLIIGMAHLLSWWPLFLINAIITTIILVLSLRTSKSSPLPGDIPLLFKSLWNIIRASNAFAVLFLLVLFVLGWYTYLGQLLPPMTWDSWAYHLPWAAFANQEGHLGPFDVPKIAINHFPMNTDILFLWSVLGCGTERWANIVQVPFAIAGMLASYLLARRFDASRVDAAIVGTFIIFVPTVHDQMWTAMVDVAVMGMVLTAFAFLSRKNVDPVSILIAGLAAGFIAGSKGSGIYLFISLLLYLAFRLAMPGETGCENERSKRLKQIISSVAIFCGLTLILGSYFYLRNWVTTGNPTGSFDVEIFGLTLFSGEKVWQDVIFNPVNAGPVLYEAGHSGSEWPIVFDGFFDPQTYMAGGNIGGWGSTWTVLLLPAIPIVLAQCVIKRNWKFLAFMVTAILPYFLFRYNHTFVRYHLQILAIGTVAFGYMLTNLDAPRIRRLLLGIALVLTVLTVFLAGAKKQGILMPRDIARAREVPYSENYRGVLSSDFIEPVFFDALAQVQEPGNTLALSDSLPKFMNLAAWNPDYTNRVVWVEWVGNGEEWVRELHEKGADAVYLPPGSEALQWLMTNPSGFELLSHDRNHGAILEIPD